jgi:hypothetical protein
MRELNSRVSLDKQEPEKVAADYLKAEGFVGGGLLATSASAPA